MKRRSTVFWSITLAAGLATALALAAGPFKPMTKSEAEMRQTAAAQQIPPEPAPLDQAQPAAFETATFALG